MKRPILTIDNYDSFTYNLVQYLEELGREVVVRRNDQIALADVDHYEEIVLSPGPGIPDEAGLLKEIIRTYADRKKILGVCLGHQAIAEVFGVSLVNLPEVYHGVGTPIRILENSGLFAGLPEEIEVGRYHSWVIDPGGHPDLVVTSVDAGGQIMSFRHVNYAVCGVQFHPESILTPYGKQILNNWLTQPHETRTEPAYPARDAQQG